MFCFHHKENHSKSTKGCHSFSSRLHFPNFTNKSVRIMRAEQLAKNTYQTVI